MSDDGTQGGLDEGCPDFAPGTELRHHVDGSHTIRDLRSHCQMCGEWRDSPTTDCAACGYEDDGRTSDQIDDDLAAMASGNFI